MNNEDVSAIGINPLGPSRKVKAAVRKAVKDIKVSPVMHAEKFLGFLSSRYGVKKSDVLLANSLKELVYCVLQTLRPKKVLIMGPALPVYEEASLLSGAAVSHIFGDERFCFSVTERELSGHGRGADLAFIANPNRVTGRYLDRKDLDEVLSYFAGQNITVVLDEALIEFSEVGSLSDRIEPYADGIRLRSTSYFYGVPGLELAYAVSSPHTATALHDNYHGTLSVLALEAARAACRDKAYHRLSRQFLSEEKSHMARVLKKFTGLKVYDTDTNMILVKGGEQSRNLLKMMRDQGLRILDCGSVRGLGPDFLSIPVMKHEENIACLRIVHRIFSRVSQE